MWDWDRSSADDPLGHFEVNIGEELLAQEVGSGKKDVYILSDAKAVCSVGRLSPFFLGCERDTCGGAVGDSSFYLRFVLCFFLRLL